MKKSALLFLIPFLLLTSCGKEKPNPSFDGNYFRYPEPKYKVLNYGESIVIDFEKELFSDGTMSTYNNGLISIKENYDCIRLDSFFIPNVDSGVKIKQISSFKFRITNKNITEFCVKSRPKPYFYNTKTNMRSSAAEIYHLYFQPKEEYIVKVKSYNDFFDICQWSSVRLCNDIDFSNRGGIKAQLIDTNGTGYFEGCFFNPDHHVIRNWDEDDPPGGWKSIMFSDLRNALLDSLIFENISYHSMEEEKTSFGLLARSSYNSHFNNITVRNLNFEITGGTVGGLVAESVQDDFTNCNVEANIISNGNSWKSTNNQIGALAANHFSVNIEHTYPWTHDDSLRNDFYSYYPFHHYSKEDAVKINEEKIKDYQNKPILRNNHVKVNLENPTYCVGGFFGCSDTENFDETNTVEGHIKGYRVGKFRGMSSLYWRLYETSIDFEPEPGKIEELDYSAKN